MSFWNKIIDTFNGAENKPPRSRDVSHNPSSYGFVDVEVGLKDKRIHDIGALLWNGAVFHSADRRELRNF